MYAALVNPVRPPLCRRLNRDCAEAYGPDSFAHKIHVHLCCILFELQQHLVNVTLIDQPDVQVQRIGAMSGKGCLSMLGCSGAGQDDGDDYCLERRDTLSKTYEQDVQHSGGACPATHRIMMSSFSILT
jgi:hypothetical protein